MPHYRIPTAHGPLYLPPPLEEPDVPGRAAVGLAFVAIGVLLVFFASMATLAEKVPA